MVHPIFVYGSDVLRMTAETVDLTAPGIAGEVKMLVGDMFETMYKADGLGLAAPQIGKSIRVLVVDGLPLSDELPELKESKRAMINPVVVEESDDEVEYSEGCLSIPDIHANVSRAEWIRVAYFDEELSAKEEIFDGYLCRMVQHEMDHLDGVLFVDKIAPIRKKMLVSKLNGIKSGKTKPHYKTAK